jgi:phospholipid/cholesterol/gamma-HCH transport system permease protein
MSFPEPGDIRLSGHWTALGVGALDRQIDIADLTLAPGEAETVVDGTAVETLDSVGVWMLQKLLRRLREAGHVVRLQGWPPRFARLIELVATHNGGDGAPVPMAASPSTFPLLDRIGGAVAETGAQMVALFAFIGETSIALAGSVARPARLRWRPILHNIASAGVDALPIVGLLSFLLGVVVAYQAADQLRQYGANIFVADLVGLSMLREFAPLITAIIVAGRSGSAYAAQIGSMSVSEEIDAMRTIGIPPIDALVLPKIIALVIALPLLTFFADVLGVLGGMVMARAQLGVGFADFLDRFVKAVSVTAYVTGIGKAPVFAAIIAVVGCFQGFRTRGGADGVGRQTTRAVVQSIFLVVVADALFSVCFSILGL